MAATNDLAQNIHALLYALGRPLSRSDLAKMTGASVQEIDDVLETLIDESRGTIMVDDGKMLELRIAGGAAKLIEKARKEEFDQGIGKVGLEALAAVLYRGPLTRSELDFIRGVNSAQTLRTLTIRGLLRRVPNPKMERSFLYEPTTELLSTLGISRAKELPSYVDVRDKLQKLEDTYRAAQDKPNEA